MPFEEIASVIFVQSSKENLRIRQLAGNEVNELDDDGQDKKLKSFGMISTLKFIWLLRLRRIIALLNFM